MKMITDVLREMAVGNTFGATALSSYGGFWLAFAIVLTPGGFEIEANLGATSSDPSNFYNSMGLFLMVSSTLFANAVPISRQQY
jgi:succinate-acetate transporter protein